MTVEQVTPAVFPAGPLFPSEVDFFFDDSVYLILFFLLKFTLSF